MVQFVKESFLLSLLKLSDNKVIVFQTSLSVMYLLFTLNNFAILEEKVIGYLKMNFGQSQTELKDNKAYKIERIYVLKEYHGKKLGNCLSTKQ